MMSFGYLLFYQIAGPVPFSFHLANIVLHALVVLLVFCVLRRLSGERIALIAAGLFALHPIHTESVAWIAGVTDLELALFYLLAFLFYLRLEDPASGIGIRAAMCGCFARCFRRNRRSHSPYLPRCSSTFTGKTGKGLPPAKSFPDTGRSGRR
jgi:hypothetical protein